jgi:hypothetical protein
LKSQLPDYSQPCYVLLCKGIWLLRLALRPFPLRKLGSGFPSAQTRCSAWAKSPAGSYGPAERSTGDPGNAHRSLSDSQIERPLCDLVRAQFLYYLARCALLRAGLRQSGVDFSFAYPAFTPQRAMRTFGDMPGYYRAVPGGTDTWRGEVVGVSKNLLKKECRPSGALPIFNSFPPLAHPSKPRPGLLGARAQWAQ